MMTIHVRAEVSARSAGSPIANGDSTSASEVKTENAVSEALCMGMTPCNTTSVVDTERSRKERDNATDTSCGRRMHKVKKERRRTR